MNIEISLIHATYMSTNQGKKVRDEWLNRASEPDAVEHCLGFQSDDLETLQEFGIRTADSVSSDDGVSRCISTKPAANSSAIRNWNAAASISRGKILFLMADDTIPNYGWDIAVREIFDSKRLDECTFLKISDNRCEPTPKKDGLLPRHPVLSRALYERLGYVFNPIYSGGGPDDELLIIGLRDNLIQDARHLRIHHSYGQMFNKYGSIDCGCNRLKLRTEKNNSQRIIAMEGGNYAKIEKSWGKSWVFIYQMAANPEWADFVLKTRKRITKKVVSASRFLVSLSIRFPFEFAKSLFRRDEVN